MILQVQCSTEINKLKKLNMTNRKERETRSFPSHKSS